MYARARCSTVHSSQDGEIASAPVGGRVCEVPTLKCVHLVVTQQRGARGGCLWWLHMFPVNQLTFRCCGLAGTQAPSPFPVSGLDMVAKRHMQDLGGGFEAFPTAFPMVFPSPDRGTSSHPPVALAAFSGHRTWFCDGNKEEPWDWS